MKRKKSKKVHKVNGFKYKLIQPFLFPILLAIVLIIASLVLIQSVSFSKNVSTPKTASRISLPVVQAATSSASPSAKLKVATESASIPQSNGRSVRVPVFYYHYIGNNPNPADKARDSLSVPPDKFDEQMAYLAKNGYNPITLDTMYAGLMGGGLPAKPVVLTFDDGYVDFYDNAYPILKKYGFHAVAFIPTSLVGTGYYLNWGQISEMNSSGLISFEAHSLTHPNLVSMSYDQAKEQIFESKKVLESHVGHPVNFFAYPYGASSTTDWELVKQAGYLGAGGTWGGNIISEGNLFDFPRDRVPGQSGAEGLSSRL